MTQRREVKYRPPEVQQLARAVRPMKPQATAATVDESRAKRTKCRSRNYDPRYQCDPDEQPWGAGFAAAGIGRDINTGRAWA